MTPAERARYEALRMLIGTLYYRVYQLKQEEGKRD